MQRVSINLHDLTPGQAREVIDLVNGMIDQGLTAVENAPATKAPANKGGRPKKTAPPAPPEETEESVEVDDGFVFPDDETEATEDAYTLEDVMKAFQSYVKTFKDPVKGRESGKAIMKQFKVKSVEQFKKEDYPTLIKLLTKKK